MEKVKRQQLSLDQKLEILKESKSKSDLELAKHYKCGRTTILTIRKQKEKILSSAMHMDRKRKKMRPGKVNKTEKMYLLFCIRQISSR